MAREDVLSLLFSLFADQEYWGLKALTEISKQPATWLKEVLNDIAILNKRGVNLGTYELKPELKLNKTDTKMEGINNMQV